MYIVPPRDETAFFSRRKRALLPLAQAMLKAYMPSMAPPYRQQPSTPSAIQIVLRLGSTWLRIDSQSAEEKFARFWKAKTITGLPL